MFGEKNEKDVEKKSKVHRENVNEKKGKITEQIKIFRSKIKIVPKEN